MEKEKLEKDPLKQNISSEDEKLINEALNYEKFRDDGKNDHKKKDIEKKIKKANAVKKANKH